MSAVRAIPAAAARWAAAAGGAGLLVGVALAERRSTRSRRRRGERPRLVYGPTPIISIKFMSEALRRRGYDTTTFVYGLASINTRDDYDESLDELFGGSTGAVARRARDLAGPYIALGRLLRRGDVFHFFFDGGFLRSTPLRFLELQLLHLAGKKVVAMPYGGDVTVPRKIHSRALRDAFTAEYPQLVELEADTDKRVDYMSEHADFIVACVVHFEMLPRFDLLTTHYYPIDTDAWDEVEPRPDGGLVTVFHSPNHRAVKGTAPLEQACRELEEEGLPIRLVLAEGVPNAEVRRLLAQSDVLAEQFLVGYALSAMEGMALRKPVLSNLSDPWYFDRFREQTGLDECPIVSTTPETLKDTLRSLVNDERRRAELGAAGRRYVLKYHSYEAVADMWELVYRTVWEGEPLEMSAWHPGRTPGTPALQAAGLRGAA
jgi:hypothetical protein